MKNYFFLGCLIIGIYTASAQIGIGTTNPDSSAILEITSSEAGVLFPRMTTLQRNAISNPATGLLIYNTNTETFQYNIGDPDAANWISLESGQQSQAGTLNVGSTSSGWEYFNIVFDTPFNDIPAIVISYREGTGTNNGGSTSINQIKVANAATDGFTIGINDGASTADVFIDWIASPKTQ